jgi:hypothetical protein
MSSDLKSETARINGAKSHGPVTPEGKARSAANSRRHGLAAASIVLPGESEEHFQLLLAAYMGQFQPQTGVETDLVEVMAISRWRLRRLLAIETHQLNLEMIRRREQIDQEFNNVDHGDRLADVFKQLSYGNTLNLMLRYESSINRSFDKALKQLQQLQSNRPVGSFRNPPSPANESPDNPLGSFRNPSPYNANAQDPSISPRPLTLDASRDYQERSVPIPTQTLTDGRANPHQSVGLTGEDLPPRRIK